MTTRRTIGTSPLDALLDGPRPSSTAAPRRTPAPAESRTRSTPAATAATSPARTKATYLLPTATVERARNAAVALSGPPVRLNLAALVTEAITREVDRLERTHNAGKPFPHFGEPLKGGRPMRATSEAPRGPLRTKRR